MVGVFIQVLKTLPIQVKKQQQLYGPSLWIGFTSLEPLRANTTKRSNTIKQLAFQSNKLQLL